jgi:ribosomal-protein-alanine N-acetyltransferase
MTLHSTRLYLKAPEESDAQAMLDLELRNRHFFQQFVSLRNEQWYTLEGQLHRIRLNTELRELDQQYGFLICRQETHACIGWISLTEVLRGPLLSCYVGYYLDQQHNGKGYMTEAVRTLVEFGFNVLGLHRIEAGVMPHNAGSIKVLEKAGFHKEGIAKKNVKINGRWEDHQVLAILNPDETI